MRTVEGDGTTREVVRKAGVEDGRPADRVQPARGGQPRLRDARQAAVERADDRAHEEHRSTSRHGGARDRRRLHGLPRARDRERDRRHHRHARRPARPTCSPTARSRSSNSTCRRDAPTTRSIGRPLRQRRRSPAESKVAGDHPRRADDHARAARSASSPATASSSSPRRTPRAQLEPDPRARARSAIDDVVIFGAGPMGTTIAGVLLERDIRVRLVDAEREPRRTRSPSSCRRRACFQAQRVRPGVPRARAHRPRHRRRVLHERRRRRTSTARCSPRRTACA